jgi:hypothetical protein
VTGAFSVEVPGGAGTGGFPDARPGVAAFTDLMTAVLEAVMVGQFLCCLGGSQQHRTTGGVMGGDIVCFEPIGDQAKRVRRQTKEEREECEKARMEALTAVCGSVCLARHAMDEVTELNAYRDRLVGNDPVLNMKLLDIEVELVRAAKSVQRRYFDYFGL